MERELSIQSKRCLIVNVTRRALTGTSLRIEFV
jgi:hypothetical protein